MAYKYVDAEDFALDERFRKWVFDPSPELELFWANFQKEHPARQEAINQARALLLQFRNEVEQDQPSRAQTAKMWSRVDAHVNKSQKLKWLSAPVFRWAAAACVLIGIIILGQQKLMTYQEELPIYQQHTQETAVPLEEVLNNTQQAIRVELPDKSIVWLSANSRISFPKSFERLKKRDVYLTGMAFFSVTKNSRKPFFVYANELVTKVLGTSFWVNAYDKRNDVIVTVETGKVSVFARNDKQAERMKANRELEGVILTPNQQLRFLRSEVRMQKSLVAQPKVIFPAAPPFTYRDTPISQVFAAIEQAYGIEIIYDEEVLSHCLLTASLPRESLFQKLDLICKGIEAHYQLVDGQIVIISQGCN